MVLNLIIMSVSPGSTINPFLFPKGSSEFSLFIAFSGANHNDDHGDDVGEEVVFEEPLSYILII